MKKTIKTEVILAVFRLLSGAKYAKLDDGDKIKVWKIQRAMKPIAEKFDDDLKTSGEKLRPEGFDDRLREAQELEDKEKGAFGAIDSPQREREFVEMLVAKDDGYKAFQQERAKYVKLCNEAVKEFAEKEVELDYEMLSEDAFGKLMASNDWTLQQASFLADSIVDE